ncbi:MAG: YggS family pyridoxal phosphate-dependent enzyme [Betaproteobacteria bacterium]|nr:YggS family pyridoxal phosphate-dependent enzyme [Betaproteobacteria bacterium]
MTLQPSPTLSSHPSPSFEHRLQAVTARIAQACAQAERAVQTVKLLAVSKTQPSDAVREAVAAGLHDFGENYVQEALDKMAALADLRPRLTWHLIGPLQSNKTRVVAESFDWVHSVDRLKIAQRLSDQRPADRPPLNVCLQVNVSGESSKSGVAPNELLPLAQAVAALPGLRLRGLMSIPAPTEDPQTQRLAHHALHALWQDLRAAGLAVDTLSMGMSADLESAIAEGSTLVRVGTALFGERSRPPTSPPPSSNG